MEEVLNSELVFVGDNNEALTDTYKVAEVFGKEHNKVCRDINNLGCSSDFQNANFGVSFIIRDLPNGGHKKEKYYTMTKDGFTFLVMGYTGAKQPGLRKPTFRPSTEWRKSSVSRSRNRSRTI